MKTITLTIAFIFALSIAANCDAQRPDRDGKRKGAGEQAGGQQSAPGQRQRAIEPAAMSAKMMKQFDKNGDNKLDVTELTAMFTSIRENRGGRDGRTGQDGQQGMQGNSQQGTRGESRSRGRGEGRSPEDADGAPSRGGKRGAGRGGSEDQKTNEARSDEDAANPGRRPRGEKRGGKRGDAESQSSGGVVPKRPGG